MTSPFAIFRKNQKVAYAGLVLMSMIAFVFLDPIMKGLDQRANASHAVVAKLNSGNIDQGLLRNLIMQRQLANSFVREVIISLMQAETGNDQEAQMKRNQLQMQAQRYSFSYGLPQREDVVFGYILGLEADKIGVRVSNSAVDSYLDQLSDNRLSSAQFQQIVTDMKVSRKSIYDALGAEIRSRIAFQMSAPLNPQSPGEYWKFYRQLKVRESLEVAAVPVSQFAADVEKPADPELEAFFEKYKDKLPNQPPEYEPGFRQPRRVQLQYLKANFTAVEKLVLEPTADEVTKYYEEHKENYVERPKSSTKFPSDDSNPLNPEFSADGDDVPAVPDDLPESIPSADKPEPEATPEKKTETPAKPDAPANDGEPAPEKPAADKPATDKPEENAKPGEEAKPKDEANPDSKAQGALDEPRSNQALFAVEDEAATKTEKPEPVQDKPAELTATEKPEAEKTDADKPAEPKPETAAEKTPADAKPEGDKPATEAAPAAPDGQTPPAEKTEPVKTEPEKKYKPLDELLRQEISEKILEERTMVAMKELADRSADAMVDLALRLATLPALDGKVLYVDLNANGQREKDEPSVEVAGKVNPESLTPAQSRLLAAAVAEYADHEMEKISKEIGMGYAQTDLISGDGLQNLPPLSGVTEMTDNEFRAQGSTSLAEQVFSDESLLRPLKGLDEKSNLYVTWKVQDVPAHVPDFANKLIQEEVLTAWKVQKARPAALKRAEELAKQVNASQKPMAETLGGQTVTGDKNGLNLTVQQTPSFTWMETSSASSPNPFSDRPAPEISKIPLASESEDGYLPGVNERFMEIVFDELKPGETGVAPSQDQSIFYVVKVINREPATAEEIQVLRDQFRGEWKGLMGFNIPGFRMFSTPYQDLAQKRQMETGYQWRLALEKQYGLQWVEDASDQDVADNDY